MRERRREIRQMKRWMINGHMGFPGGASGEEPLASTGDPGDLSSIPGLGRSPGGGHGNPLQYSCLRLPWTQEPGRLQSTGSQRVRHN